MARAPKLKVYSTSIGFYDALVAAPTQKAALKAWGTTTDLFGAGRATIVNDPDQQAAALTRPGEVIKRPRGGDPEKLIAAMEADDRAERSKPAPKGAQRAPKAANDARSPPAPPPDRSALDAAEAALSEARAGLSEQMDAIAGERDGLDRREAAVREDGDRRIIEARAARDLARDEYERAARRHIRAST